MTELALPLRVQGLILTGKGTRWEIAGDDPEAYNEPGGEPGVRIEEDRVADVADRLTVAPCSITLFALAVE